MKTTMPASTEPTIADLLAILVDAKITLRERAYTAEGKGDYTRYMRVVREIRAMGIEVYLDQPLSLFDKFQAGVDVYHRNDE